jgi:hypothetical protein
MQLASRVWLGRRLLLFAQGARLLLDVFRRFFGSTLLIRRC